MTFMRYISMCDQLGMAYLAPRLLGVGTFRLKKIEIFSNKKSFEMHLAKKIYSIFSNKNSVYQKFFFPKKFVVSNTS